MNQAPDPEAIFVITGRYRLVLENYPDGVSTPAEAAAFDEAEIAAGDMPLSEVVRWGEYSDTPLTIQITAVSQLQAP